MIEGSVGIQLGEGRGQQRWWQSSWPQLGCCRSAAAAPSTGRQHWMGTLSPLISHSWFGFCYMT